MKIYTDGASSHNQNAGLREGGLAFVLVKEKKAEVYYQYEKGATNNQMELKAFLYALETLSAQNQVPPELDLYTDSQYLIGCFSGNKIKKKRGTDFKN